MQNLFVSLGAGPHQLPLIEAARARGYKVVAVDRSDSAPGLADADYRIGLSILRPASVRKELRTIPGVLRGVATRSYGKALLSSAALSRSLGLAGPGSRAVQFFQNKLHYKERLRARGVLVPRAYTLHELPTLENPGPIIARPVSGHGKLGVQILRTREQRESFAFKARGEWLIEEIIRGTEITVLGACHRGLYKNVFMTSKRISHQPPLFAEIMHRYPALAPGRTAQRIERICQHIVNASKLQTSPFVSEFILSDEGDLYLVECAPETGGEFLADYAFSAATRTNYFSWLIALLTENQMPQIPVPRRGVVIRYILPREGNFGAVTLPPWLSKNPGFIFGRTLLAPGMHTDLEHGNLHRLAAFGLAGPETEIERIIELADRAAQEATIEYESA